MKKLPRQYAFIILTMLFINSFSFVHANLDLIQPQKDNLSLEKHSDLRQLYPDSALEISQPMGILDESVHTTGSRLRKKLHLSKDTTLEEFIANV